MAELIIDVHCGFGATPVAPTWGDPAAVRDALLARGIRTVFLSSDLASRYDPAAGNELVAQAIAQITGANSGGLDARGWMVLHPDRLADANTQMRRLLGGDRFVGAALYADPLSGVPVTLRSAQEVVSSYRRYSRPLLIETPTAEAMYEAARIAQDVGGTVKVIASGMGGEEWREAVDLATKPLNLFLDIAGSLSPEKIEYAIAALGGTRKLLFASGAPDTDPAAVLGLLDELNLDSEDRERILSGNALRLFSLPGAEASPADNAGASSRPAPSLSPLRPL